MGDYPREIKLDPDTESRLVSYVESELLNHDAERGEFVDRLVRWQKEYWAEPITERATFPFEGAATIVIPLAAIAIEAIHSRNMTTLFALSQFISVKSHTDEYADLVDPLEKFLDNEFIKGMKIEQQLQSPALEFVKFGTAVGKSGYEKTIRTAVRPTAEGKEEEFTVITKQGPTIDGVPLNRFIMPFAAQNPQEAPWCGEYHTRTAYEVLNMIQSNFFATGTREKLEQWLTMAAQSVGTEQRFTENQATQQNQTPVWPKTITWAEVWLGFDVDQSGVQKEIVVHYHKESRQILSARYNWYSDLHRPYRIGQYIPVEYRWAGVGVCKQSEQFQKEITTQHRQRLDNATLANVRMLAVNKLSGYGPKEPIFPGKMWFVDNMEDIKPFAMGEIYPSAYNDETATLQYYQQRSGINEQNLGMPAAGTPGTATSDLARIQEGNKKHDYTYRNFKRFANELVLDATCNIHQFGPYATSYLSDPTRKEQLSQFFQLPIEVIREACCIEIVVAAQQQNKLVDRQNYQQIIAATTQYFTQLYQLAASTGNQQLMQLIGVKAPIAATQVFKQMLETFDVPKIDKIILGELLANASTTPIGAPESTGIGGASQLILPPGVGDPSQTLSAA